MTPAPLALSVVSSYLDSLLRIRDVPDEPNAVNGLQVENSGEVCRIIAAVDASQATIDAIARRAGTGSLLLVHHGLLWDGNVPVAGRRYRRIKTLIQHDIALYSAHIPLDLHPELGNNVALAQSLGMDVAGWFGNYRGVALGVHGALSCRREELCDRLNRILTTQSRLIPGGPEQVHRVGIVTGSAGNMIAQARDAGLDTFITGEGAHHTFFDATEWGVNVIYAGHYATEKLGVQRLAQHLSERFAISWEFHEHDTGL